MQVEFYRAEDPETVAGIARWNGNEAELERAEDAATGAAIVRIFRATPVVTDDASLRTLSGKGESVIEPGSLDWFREAALVRGPKVGLTPRFVPVIRPGDGFDPAAQYRTFTEQMARLAAEDEEPGAGSAPT